MTPKEYLQFKINWVIEDIITYIKNEKAYFGTADNSIHCRYNGYVHFQIMDKVKEYFKKLGWNLEYGYKSNEVGTNISLSSPLFFKNPEEYQRFNEHQDYLNHLALDNEKNLIKNV